jgi:hypothetical protein
MQGFGRGGIGRETRVGIGGREVVCRGPEEVLLPSAQAIALVDKGEDSCKDPHAVQGLAGESNRILVEEVVMGTAQLNQASGNGQDQGFKILEGLLIVAHGAKVGRGNGLEDMFGGFGTLPELSRQCISRWRMRADEDWESVTVCQKSVKVEGIATSPDDAWTMLDLRSLWTAPMLWQETDVLGATAKSLGSEVRRGDFVCRESHEIVKRRAQQRLPIEGSKHHLNVT